jgi:hypothetical protein
MEIEKLIKAYVRLRDARSEIKREFDEKDAELLEKMDTIEAALLEHAKEHNLDSMKTKYGTATRRVTTRFWAPDWSSFGKFLSGLGDDAFSLVEPRIQQTNFKQFLAENPDVIPPVNATSKHKITVRRANSE